MLDQEYINPNTIAKPSGYTHVVKVDKTVYISGQVSLASDGSIVGKGDPEAQVRQIWRNIEAAVQSVGGTLRNVVKTTTYVTSTDHMSAVRKVRDEVHEGLNPPTSTLLVISALAHPDFLVEIEAVAVVDAQADI